MKVVESTDEDIKNNSYNNYKNRRKIKMSRKIKWGVLGTANIARKCTIPGMKKAKNCQLYGIAGRNKEKVDQFQEEFGFEKAYYSLEEMLDDPEIEAVYIPLPNTLHKEWVLKAAAKGKHILCEKPLSGTEKDVREMIEGCEKAGVVFMEAFAYLHSPLVTSVKETLKSGVIGKLSFMESIFITPGYTAENIRVRRDTLGGSIYDLGCYCTSLMLTLFEEEPKEVKAVGHFTEQHIDDFASAYFHFDDERRACMVSGMCSAQRGDRFFLYGTEGTMEVPVPFNADGELHYYVKKGDTCQEIKVVAPDNYCLEVEQLGECILEGAAPHVAHEFSLQNARVMDKILNEIGY